MSRVNDKQVISTEWPQSQIEIPERRLTFFEREGDRQKERDREQEPDLNDDLDNDLVNYNECSAKEMRSICGQI